MDAIGNRFQRVAYTPFEGWRHVPAGLDGADLLSSRRVVRTKRRGPASGAETASGEDQPILLVMLPPLRYYSRPSNASCEQGSFVVAQTDD
jgi:hypothetical protein